jgi:retron-type reverse transcriptase
MGRVTVDTISNARSYSTGSTTESNSNVAKKLESLFKRSEKFPHETIYRPLYKIICTTDILNIAYNKIKSNPGQMTPGVKPEILDGMSLEVLQNISEKLKDESFQFSPARRVEIPKTSGGTRPLIIASPRDKIVQEAMRLILEAIFEPTFLESSHGFRPSRGCHSALKAVREQFQTAT